VGRALIRTVWRSDAAYPALLREIPDPPERLYLAGKDLEQGPAIAVVGSRRATRYGLEVAHWLAAELASDGLTVVSGLARGIDAAAHRGALSVGGSTIAVMGCGLDICYPASHRSLFNKIAEQGSLISEHQTGTPPLAFHFPIRNRIIAGMTLGVVIVEGVPNGGAMITARLAMEFGREVFAVPGAVHSRSSLGPHLLIRDGARLAGSAAQILEDLGISSTPRQVPELDALHPDEQRLMDSLEAEPELLDVIARKVRMPVSTATAILVKLEMKSLATRYPGGRYSRSVGTAPT
jgi:DNA processing protein